MEKVKIYKITCTDAWSIHETGKFASLSPWQGNTSIDRGWDDGGVMYRLPDGYTLGKDWTDNPAIVDPSGFICDLRVTQADNILLSPAYSGQGGKGIVLHPVDPA